MLIFGCFCFLFLVGTDGNESFGVDFLLFIFEEQVISFLDLDLTFQSQKGCGSRFLPCRKNRGASRTWLASVCTRGLARPAATWEHGGGLQMPLGSVLCSGMPQDKPFPSSVHFCSGRSGHWLPQSHFAEETEQTLRPLPGLRRPRFSVSATQQADVSKEVKLLFFCLLFAYFSFSGCQGPECASPG